MRPISFHHSCLLALACCVNCLLPFGCRSPLPTSTVSHGSIGWEAKNAESYLPGTDQAMLSWFSRENRLAYVVWTDLPGGTGTAGSSGGSTAGQEQHLANLEASDGTRFEFEYSLNHEIPGSQGKVTINEIDYPLENGSLLLVSTSADDLKVKQIQLDATMMQLLLDDSLSRASISESLQQRANEHSGISGFFKSIKSTSSNGE